MTNQVQESRVFIYLELYDKNILLSYFKKCFFHLYLQGKIVSCFDALMRACKKIATVSFGVLKKIAITALGPLLDYGLYYYDLYSDTYFTYTLANNCHWRFFTTSIGILVSSYIITVAYLRYHLQVIL